MTDSETRIEAAGIEAAIDQLVDEYRSRCLWFLRSDYYPLTREQRLHVLADIARHADVQGFRKAAELKRWLLQSSNAASAA